MGEKSIRLVTALVECRPDGEYVPWGIKWYDGRIFPFAEVGWHETRSWVLGEGRACESWRVKMGMEPCATSATTATAGTWSMTWMTIGRMTDGLRNRAIVSAIVAMRHSVTTQKRMNATS